MPDPLTITITAPPEPKVLATEYVVQCGETRLFVTRRHDGGSVVWTAELRAYGQPSAEFDLLDPAIALAKAVATRAEHERIGYAAVDQALDRGGSA